MSSKWYVWLPIVVIVTVALLVGGGYAIYRGGWESGYAAGQSAGEEDEAETVPWLHHGFGRAWHPVSLGGVLLGVLLFILAMKAICHGIRLLAWRSIAPGTAGPTGGLWRRRWRRFHGPGDHTRWHHGPWAHWECAHPPCDEEPEAEGAEPAKE